MSEQTQQQVKEPLQLLTLEQKADYIIALCQEILNALQQPGPPSPGSTQSTSA